MNCVFITKERKLFSSSSPVLKIRPTSANSSKTNTNKRGGGRLKGVSVARLKTLRIWYSAVQVLHRHFFTSFGRTGNQVKINLPPAEKETFGDKKKFGGQLKSFGKLVPTSLFFTIQFCYRQVDDATVKMVGLIDIKITPICPDTPNDKKDFPLRLFFLFFVKRYREKSAGRDASSEWKTKEKRKVAGPA